MTHRKDTAIIELYPMVEDTSVKICQSNQDFSFFTFLFKKGNSNVFSRISTGFFDKKGNNLMYTMADILRLSQGENKSSPGGKNITLFQFLKMGGCYPIDEQEQKLISEIKRIKNI